MIPKFTAYTIALILLGSNIYSQNHGNVFYGGTSIVMIYMKDSIWIAADSKTVTTANIGNDKTKNLPTCTCKIIEVNNVISASAGHFTIDYSNNVLIYDISIETKRAILKGRNIRDAINILSDTTVKYLTRIINNIKNDNDDSFKALFNGDDLISTVFGTFVNNNNYAAGLRFILVGNPDNWHVGTELKEHLGEEAGIVMGFKDSISYFLGHNPNYLRSDKFMETKLRYLINLEVLQRSDKVGKPIDVIVLYKNGFRWLPKKRKSC